MWGGGEGSVVLPRISKKHIRIQQNHYLRIIGIRGY